jgi:hypothetical protein
VNEAVVLAIVRPGSWDLPLFLHVAGASILVGAAVTAVAAALLDGRPKPGREGRERRSLTFASLLAVALPAFIVMRVGAEWIHGKEFAGGADPRWVVFGYTTADGGAVLLLAAIVLAWLSLRRDRPRLGLWSGVLAGLVAVGWVATVWVMGAKPL